jgi:uncharacterized protein YciI
MFEPRCVAVVLNRSMATFAVHYDYDDRSQLRDELRGVHRAYLADLADAGVAVAYARYQDDGPAGALLIFRADDAVAVEGLLSNDPFMVAGLVVDHQIRSWEPVGPWAD